MRRIVPCSISAAALIVGFSAVAFSAEPVPEVVQFNRDVRPILSDNCFACHGPDENKREAGLRLDTKEGALAWAIQPGNADESELMRRLVTDDPEMRMPPASTGKHLGERQIAILRRWIEQGARWEAHWSLIPPVRPALPSVENEEWVHNPIDRFILARLENEQLAPSPDADKRTLLRRVSFDLIGLPPTPEQMDAFLADESPEAFARAVDQLLASQHYGERMAVWWLDLVRYADTAGYHSDNHRDVYLYRDYVINAFNNNKPFDQFTIEQLAGDLLPEASREQRIASGFNRLLQTTEEGGAQPKEYTAKYGADRVRNTSTIWLGLTMGCSECHDHKFDPLSIREFYSFQAFFADIAEIPVGRQPQTAMPTPEQEQQLADLDAQLTELRAALEAPSSELSAAQAEWEAELRAQIAASDSSWTVLAPAELETTDGTTLTVLDDHSVLASGANPDKETYSIVVRSDAESITALRLETLRHETLTDNRLSRANGNFVLTHFEVEQVAEDGSVRPIAIASADADFAQDGFPIALAIDNDPSTGWAVNGHVQAMDRTAIFRFAEPLAGPATLRIRLHHQSIYPRHAIGRFRLATSAAEQPALGPSLNLPSEIVQTLRVDPESLSPEQKAQIFKFFRSVTPQLQAVRDQIATVEQQRNELIASFPQTLVTTSVEPRTVRVLARGNWLDESGEIVTPATPAALNPLPPVEGRPTRLDLARWMLADDNPLVARVFVNRLWRLCFGEGLVRTLEDFGTQGEWPTHPELLDWLAVEFRESGWDIKHIHRLMVTSHAYRQSSAAPAALRQRDPDNRLLARQNRFRLDAEFVRDTALSVSGLLVPQVGGPSVKPYQPAGYWANLNFPKREWQADTGAALYRRGLYTYWCRSFLHPAMLAFDASSREECMAARPRSNTPLQSLVLLNDPQFVEAARALAQRVLREAGSSDEQRIELAIRLVLNRAPIDAERAVLRDLVARHRAEYAADSAAVDALLAVGEWPVAAELDRVEVAAWTSAARTLLNLHEAITRN